MTDQQALILAAAVGSTGTIVALLLTGVGRLAWRFVSGGALTDRASLYGSMTATLAQMRANGFSPDDVDQFEHYLRSKRTAGNRRVFALTAVDAKSEIPPADSQAEPYEPRTQTAMNMVAHARVIDSNGELAAELERFRSLLSNDEQELLDDAQEAWSTYRNLQSELEAAQYKGGSIQPLIRDSEFHQITMARIAQIIAARSDRESR